MKQRKSYSIEVDCVPTAFAISLTCKPSGLSSCFSMKRRTLCARGGEMMSLSSFQFYVHRDRTESTFSECVVVHFKDK